VENHGYPEIDPPTKYLADYFSPPTIINIETKRPGCHHSLAFFLFGPGDSSDAA